MAIVERCPLPQYTTIGASRSAGHAPSSWSKRPLASSSPYPKALPHSIIHPPSACGKRIGQRFIKKIAAPQAAWI